LRPFYKDVEGPFVNALSARTLGLSAASLAWAAVCLAGPAHPQDPPAAATWTKLDTLPSSRKQDDIFFVDPDVGWYVNGSGKIYQTRNGGASWKEQLSRPGTFFRCIGFLDEKHGFAGNLGPDYYPGVTDDNPLYETRDGGDTWSVVKVGAGSIKGLCAIDIVTGSKDGTSGKDARPVIYAGGRVGGPAALIKSADRGRTWESLDPGADCGMILDVKFFDSDNGFLCASTSADLRKSNALILATADGGKTWSARYRSSRPYELTWKFSFPSRDVGYVTLQSYDPSPEVSQRLVLKTVDGGKSWNELALVDDHACREFGVGFLDENTGWVGTGNQGYETRDGGKTWKPVAMGHAINKIRFIHSAGGTVAYAIGIEVLKITLPPDKKGR